MKIEAEFVQAEGTSNLDPIEVFWHNLGPGRGSVTITCFGSAWTAYFGGMGDARTIQAFFLQADTGYLVTKLGITPQLKQGKRYDAYLGRIIEAVKGFLRASIPQAAE